MFLEHIQVLRWRVSFSAQAEGQLPPYLGSTLRGVMGHAMRDFVCTQPTLRCYLCKQKTSCAYAQCFCSPGNEAGAVNPFVLHPLAQGKTQWAPGEHCNFDLILIGNIVGQAGFFLDALQAMPKYGWGAARVPFRLESIVSLPEQRLICHRGRLWLRNVQPKPLYAENRGAASAALVKFETPVRILVGRELCRSLPFDVLVQSLSRRVALLSQAYTDKLVEWDEAALLDSARDVKTAEEAWRFVDFTRYSMNRNSRKLPLPAIEGQALYEGDLTPFIPLLEAGRILHVGKNSTIGFGRYSVAYER